MYLEKNGQVQFSKFNNEEFIFITIKLNSKKFPIYKVEESLEETRENVST